MGVRIDQLEPEAQSAIGKACAHIDGLGSAASLLIEPLTGGITNRNYRLIGGRRDIVLRLHGKDTELLGIDRRCEFEAAVQAASLGLAPGVAGLLEPELYLITDFVHAQTADLGDPDVFASAVARIKAWHASPAVSGRFDTFGLAETYARTASSRGVVRSAGADRAVDLSKTVGAVFANFDDPLVPGHNDLLGANFLTSTDEPGRVWLIDWEYAGMNTRWFDLGNFSINNGFDDATNDRLLELYFGEVTPVVSARLTLMRVMSDVRESMWGVVQQGISTLDYDYLDYANQHFDRMMMNATTPSFANALRTAVG